MRKTTKAVASPKERAKWEALLKSLFDDIVEWAEDKHWPTAVQEKVIEEQAIGSYPVRVLNIKTPAGWLIAEPVAYSVVGAQGRVDLYSFPTFHRAVLLWDGRKWKARLEYKNDVVAKWDRKTFLSLAVELTSKA